MTDYTTIRVTEEAKAKAEDSKLESETWNDYLLRCTENPPERREFVDTATVTAELDATERQRIAEEIAEKLR